MRLGERKWQIGTKEFLLWTLLGAFIWPGIGDGILVHSVQFLFVLHRHSTELEVHHVGGKLKREPSFFFLLISKAVAIVQMGLPC